MRDTLLLVLACVGGTSVILTACLAMWVAGNACVDWYDRIVASRRRVAAIEQADRAWSADVNREVLSRRAGARGESDG